MNWIALESNPDVLNHYLTTLQVTTPLCFQDVYGLDPELLQLVPQPVDAVIFLFPITDEFERRRADQLAGIEQNGQETSPNLFFTRQTIGNACGTIGVIHCLANSRNVSINQGPFGEYMSLCKDCKSPEERAKVLESCKAMYSAHHQEATKGQTEAPAADSDTDLHFIAFVKVDDHLYELDGRSPLPINHGPCNDILSDSAKQIKQIMDLTPLEGNFSVIAFAGSD